MALEEDDLSYLFDSRYCGDAGAGMRDFIGAASMRLKAPEIGKDLYRNCDVQTVLIATCVEDQGF